MNGSSRETTVDSPSTAGRARMVALASLLVLAGCGGEPKGSAAGAPADTAAPAAAPTPADTTTKADTGMKADTAMKGTAGRSDTTPTSTAAKPAATPKPASASKPTSAPKPTAVAASADAPLRDEYHKAPRDTVSQDVYDGWKQFNLNCARCHGEDVTGTTIAPHLIMSLKPDGPINSKELFISTVCSGRPAKGMPAWCSLGLGMDKIQEIYSYVKGRSDGKLAPGRPAVKSQG